MRAGRTVVYASLLLVFTLLFSGATLAQTTNDNCGVPIVCPGITPACTVDDQTCYVSETSGGGFELPFADSDRDGTPDCAVSQNLPKDNCICDPNPSQADSDGDGIGDACESGGILSITKTGPDVLLNGQTGTYTITIKNDGSAQEVVVHDSFSHNSQITGFNGVTLTRVLGSVSMSPQLVSNPNSLFTTGGLRIPNFQGTATITYRATAGQPGTPGSTVNGAQLTHSTGSIPTSFTTDIGEEQGTDPVIEFSKTVNDNDVSDQQTVTFTLRAKK